MSSPQPIRFSCRAQFAAGPQQIAAQIADLARWSEFQGYGFLPGIAQAEFEEPGGARTGARIRVRNTDGSTHVEEILAWEPERRILMKLHEFTPPLSRLASHFTEEWLFFPQEDRTEVHRRFEMFPRGPAARPLLWLISRLFRRAIERQLKSLQTSKG